MSGRNIVLIGMMGSGKTAVGRALAKRTGRDFIDVDDVIRGDSTVAAIFESEGETGFRSREREAIAQVARHEGAVIATGGGVVLDPGNLAAFDGADIVYLQAHASTLAIRIGDPASRPLLAGQPPERLASILAERRALYEDAAQHVVTTDDKDIETVVNEIVELIA